MKHKFLVIITIMVIISSAIVSCTRSASGGPADKAVDNSELPNPVSTQSQLMKDIISGTQTAMAIPLDATEEINGEDSNSTDTADGTSESTPEPTEKPEDEIVVLPTSTAGPPPKVALEYNSSACQPGYYICEISHVQDQTVTLQSSHPYLYADEEITFKLGPEGEYDYSKYITAGTAKYKPDLTKGVNFQVTLTIPDSLRGVGQIVVRLETIDPGRFGMFYYDNN
ncbi:MAG: hypothetical protein J7L66_02420 [Anaerolineaceae bacterium]|nr:hypothetical protein [Anaerolineaceae bacterium]